MKTLFAFLTLWMVLCFVALGCGSGSEEAAGDNAVSSNSPAATDQAGGSTTAAAETEHEGEEHAESADDHGSEHEGEAGKAEEDKPQSAEKQPSQSQGSQPSKQGGGLDAALVSTGKDKFQTVGCMNCHSVGGKGGKSAPDLSRVGAEHADVDYYMKLLVDPASMGKKSMPSFAHLPESDRRAIAEYLRSLR
jgi:mono/diheme cytochrome c family protein